MQLFGTTTPSWLQVDAYNLIGKLAPAAGTNTANFVAGNAAGDQMFIQETNTWLQTAPYSSLLQSNLAGKWFVSIYSSSGNYLKTLYATDDAGVIRAVKSLLNRGGSVTDNVNPDYDLNDSAVNCWG